MMIDRAAATGLPGCVERVRDDSPADDRPGEEAEILVLRHQITVLERQLGKETIRFTPSDRAFLAALLHRLPLHVLRRSPPCSTLSSRSPRRATATLTLGATLARHVKLRSSATPEGYRHAG